MQKIASVLLALLSFSVLTAAPALRPLWSRPDNSTYPTSWHLCGPFFADRSPLHLEQDYLQGWGMRSEKHPVNGTTELRSDGTVMVWKAYTVKEKPATPKAGKPDLKPGTPNHEVDICEALGVKPPENASVYAFTLVQRKSAGEACLVLDRNAGISIWVNGLPVYRDGFTRDSSSQPIVPVQWHEGENTLLVKLNCTATKSTFCLRVMEADEADLLVNSRESREWTTTLIPDGDTLTVQTGDRLARRQIIRRNVEIRVSGAGNRAVTSTQVIYGEPAVFDTTTWPDGGYDITCRLLPLPGEISPADTTPVLTHFLWYKGDVQTAAKRLVMSAPRESSDDPVQMIHAMLADLLKHRMGADLSSIGRLSDVTAALMEWEEIQRQAKEPERPVSAYFVRLAYRDEIDGAPQFARVYLPPGYDPANRYPLIVMLHGMNRTNPPYVQWGGVVQRYDATADRYGAIVLHPFGRANAWYRGLGDRDVVRCLQMAQARFAVDPDRVYLMGYSMGGAGTWHVGSAHPELFTALAPYYGGLEPQVTLPKATLDAMTPREKRNIERFSSFAQVESLLTTPVFVSHGDQDIMVPIDITRHGIRLMHSWGYQVQYWEQPGKGHERLETEDLVLPWLLSQRRVTNPKHVRLRAGSLSGARAHWVQVLQREKAEAFVSVDAQIIGLNTLRLDTDNVLAMTVTPGNALVDMQAPIRIIWNGREVQPAAVNGEEITLYASQYMPMPGEKKAAVEGPIGDIFNTPFLIVIGTISEDPAMRAYCLRYARQQVAWWQAFQQAVPRVTLDTRVTEEECARYSLLLIGGPAENRIARQLAGTLPLTIARDGVTIDGKSIPVRDGGVRMIYPNPLNADRYVVVAAANSAAGMYRLPLFTNRYDVDYAVTDGRQGRELAAGLFDRNWRFAEKLLERGEPDGKMPGVPGKLAVDTGSNHCYLSDVLEDRTEGDFDYLTGAVNTLIRPARIDGKRYGKSLCMGFFNNASSAIEYRLPAGHWQRLRATIGLESAQAKTEVVYIVKGDGKELYRSSVLVRASDHQHLDIPIEGVTTLRLEMLFTGYTPVTACWGNARIER